MDTSSPPSTFDEERAAAYDDKIRRLAPGYDVLHEAVACVADTLLPDNAHVLVVGAGTGTEIVTLGQTQPGWQFTAVDPSAEMLDRCQETVEANGLENRVAYVQERVERFSSGPQFDGVTSVFVSHFLQDEATKRRYFQAAARPLRPGAPLILADLYGDPSAPSFDSLVTMWRRSVRRAGTAPDEVDRIFDRVDRQITFAPETELSQLLRDAGFGPLTRFYQCLLWGAWWTRKGGKESFSRSETNPADPFRLQ